MKRIVNLLFFAIIVTSLTACGKGQKAQEAYNAIGNMGFSDESILTEDERATLVSLKADREQALLDKDVERLISLKSEWDSFSTPINQYIAKYENVSWNFFSESKKSFLTSDELAKYDELKEAIEKSYGERNESALDNAIKAFNDTVSPLREVIDTYTSINQNPVSENEITLLSNETISEYENLKDRTEKALSERDASVLKSLKGEWSSFTNKEKNEIESAKQKMLDDWLTGANLTNSFINLFSFGTTTSTTSIQGHTIVYTTQYNYEVDTSKMKSALDSYLSLTTAMFEGGIKSLKPYIDDVCIRVEYKDMNGSVICYKEFK